MLPVSRIAAAGALALVLAACSTPFVSPMAVEAEGGSGAPAAQSLSAAKLFVSTGRQNVIQIYGAVAPHRLIGEITKGLAGPNGQAVDMHGNLFVANADGGSVTVYAPGATKPFRTYTKDLSNPLTPAVDEKGKLYVSNFNPDGSGEIVEFPPNRLKPSFKIPLAAGAVGLALDADGNLYASVALRSGGRIIKFPPNSTQGQDLGINLKFPGRLAIDPAGNLIACDQGVPAVDIFPPGATQPSKQITSGFTDPFAVALDRGLKRLYVADGAGDTVNVYSYPELHLRSIIHRSAASFGLSVSPAAPL